MTQEEYAEFIKNAKEQVNYLLENSKRMLEYSRAMPDFSGYEATPDGRLVKKQPIHGNPSKFLKVIYRKAV